MHSHSAPSPPRASVGRRFMKLHPNNKQVSPHTHMSASVFPSYSMSTAAAVAVPSLSSDSTTAAHCAVYTSDLSLDLLGRLLPLALLVQGPPHTAPAVRRRRAPPLAAAQNAHAHLGPELRDGDSQAFTGLTFHTHRLAPRGSCQLLSFREIHGYNLDRHASDKGTYKASSSHSSTVGGASWGQVTIYIYRG